jgi:vitamin B12 transporter
MRFHFKTSFLLLSTLSAPAFAQEAPAPETPADEIVVTALRTPLPLDRIASTITVLGKAEIDRSQATILSDLLARTPGVSISRNGGFGTSTQVRIRGAETDQTVVVLDGVKLADASSTGGGYNFANMLTGDAARIEILRGPQSILWGSQAIGGVVNIATATPTEPLEGSMDIEGGSRQTVNARAAIGGHDGRIDFRFAANAFSTEGISAISPRYLGNEKDPYRNASGTGRVGVRISDAISVDLRGYYSSGRTDIDSSGTVPDSPEYSTNEEWIGYAGLNAILFGGALNNRISFSRSDTVRQNFNPSRKVRAQSFDAKGQTRSYQYQGNLSVLGGWKLVFGAEREEQKMRSASPGDSNAAYATIRAHASIDSYYAQLNGTIVDGLTVSGGVRHDHHSSFGDNDVLGGGGAWALFDGRTVLRASYGEGFKAPTLYQLYSDFGNQALQPERSHGWDAGVEQHLFDRHLILSATWFDRTTTNLILFSGCPATNKPPLCFAPGTTTARSGYYANVQRSQAHGAELAGALSFGGFSLDGNYTWTVSEDRSPGVDFGNQLPRRPRNAANGSATYVWPFGLSTGVAVRWSGKTLDTAQTSATVLPLENAAYTLVDLRAELPIGKALKLFGRVENLFDEYYETARRYGALGRSFYAGFRARF